MDLTYSFMLPILEFFEKATHSYGWALVCLTLLVRMILWPLVHKQTVEMQRFAQVQPMIKELQEKYKDNPELFQKKAAEFMSKNRVNPLGGCLPLLIQFPIFIALFATFSGPPFADKPIEAIVRVADSASVARTVKKETSDTTVPFVSRNEDLSKVAIFPGEVEIGLGETVDFGSRAVEGSKLPASYSPKWAVFDKDHKPVADDVATISEEGNAEFKKAGEYKVQAIVPGIAKEEQFGFVNGLGKVATGIELIKPENFDALALILMFGASMVLSQKYMSTSKPKPGEAMDDNQRVQQDVAKLMPIMMTGMFVVIPLPVGVLIYIVISNLVQSLQSWLLSRKPSAPLQSVTDGPDEAQDGIQAEFRDVTESGSKNGKTDGSSMRSKNQTDNRESDAGTGKGSSKAADVSSFKRKSRKKKKK